MWKLFKNKMIWKQKKKMNPKIDRGFLGSKIDDIYDFMGIIIILPPLFQSVYLLINSNK